jgi:spermidine synthase
VGPPEQGAFGFFVNSPRQIGAGLWLLSLTLMTTELVLTRIFSVVIWYHFAFVAISVALFGLGAAAVCVHRLQDRLENQTTSRLLARLCAALSLTLIGTDYFLIYLPPDWFGSGVTTTLFTQITLKLGALFVCAAAPFFVGGLGVSLLMTRYASQVHRLYFFDLFGAALGCLLTIPLLSGLGGPYALLGAAVLAAAAGVVFAWDEPGLRRRAVVWLLAVQLFGVLAMGGGWLQVRVAKGFDLAQTPLEYERWNSYSMIGVFAQRSLRGWGMSPTYAGPVPDQRQLLIDMSALTPITRFDGDLRKVGYVRHDLSALTFRAHRGAGRVAVIGAGGGKDVLAALSFGARHVDAVEINPLIVNDVMLGRYRSFSGNLYGRSDVRVHVEDGRSFLRRATGRYDVILISMVDTSAATAAGAYALTENSLYTVQAFRDYLARLAPGGVLGVSTVSMPELAVGARLATISRAALHSRHQAPDRAVFVAEAPWMGLPGATLHAFMIKPDGYAPDEALRLRQTAEDMGFRVGYAAGTPHRPQTREQSWIGQVLHSADDAALERLIARWPFDVSVVTDDRPYFFYQDRLSGFAAALLSMPTQNLFGNGLRVLAKLLLIALVLCGALILAPALGRRRTEAKVSAALPELVYVGALGLGFMFVEVPLIQQLNLHLGRPTLTLSAVLFTLLCAGAFGSRWLGPRVTSARRLGLLLAGIAGYGLVLMGGLMPVLDRLGGVAAEVRALLGALALAPLGFLLGVPYPTGLSRVAVRAPSRVPWMWGVNSTCSVLGSILATLTCMHFGSVSALGVGLALYLLAALAQLGLWSVPDAVGRS